MVCHFYPNLIQLIAGVNLDSQLRCSSIPKKRTGKQTDQICFSEYLLQHDPTAGSWVNFSLQIITVISMITIGLPCIPNIPDMSGDNMAVQKFERQPME